MKMMIKVTFLLLVTSAPLTDWLKNFEEPLGERGMLPANEVYTLFGNLDELIELNERNLLDVRALLLVCSPLLIAYLSSRWRRTSAKLRRPASPLPTWKWVRF